MSWDLFVGSQSGPIGTPDDVREKIDAILSGIDWEDPSCGYLKQREYTLEFQLLSDELDDEDEDGVRALLDGFTVSVRGGGSPLPVIVKLCKTYGWSLGDTGSGEEIDLDNPSDDGWREFQEFRDEVVDGVRPQRATSLWSRLFRRRS